MSEEKRKEQKRRVMRALQELEIEIEVIKEQIGTGESGSESVLLCMTSIYPCAPIFLNSATHLVFLLYFQ